jgi:mRNA-degrading endonuclease RelE of RelBE toxin-antitoxin system
VHRLQVHANASRDLEGLRTRHPDVVREILVKLQEFKNDHQQLITLLDHEYGKGRSQDIHVSKWQEHWRNRRDLWRFKIWCLEKPNAGFRIIYAYVPDELTFYVLAVVEKPPFDYDDENDPLIQRILADYRDVAA